MAPRAGIIRRAPPCSAMSHHEPTDVAIIAAVAALSLTLTFLAWAAWRRTGNSKLGFVTAAFFTFFVKTILTAYSVETNFIEHEHLELIGSLFDLLILLLLVAPFASPLLRRAQ